MIKHKWQQSDYTTPAGKQPYYCPICGLYSSSSIAAGLEAREYIPGRYMHWYTVEDGIVSLNPALFDDADTTANSASVTESVTEGMPS